MQAKTIALHILQRLPREVARMDQDLRTQSYLTPYMNLIVHSFPLLPLFPHSGAHRMNTTTEIDDTFQYVILKSADGFELTNFQRGPVWRHIAGTSPLTRA